MQVFPLQCSRVAHEDESDSGVGLHEFSLSPFWDELLYGKLVFHLEHSKSVVGLPSEI